MNFDEPVFKRLSHNDTGAAVGHQGGMVIPKEIENYFPDVSGKITTDTPTIDVSIEAVLMVSGRYLGKVETRYQYQTWGGTRSPERRLTSNLGGLRNQATEGDIVLFQRDIEIPERMINSLIKNDDPEFEDLVNEIGNKRWGVLGTGNPISNQDYTEASQDIDTLSELDFNMLEERPLINVSEKKKKARSASFRNKLLLNYDYRCAVTRERISTPSGNFNLDAAHIVPVEVGGSDDPRNGLLLSKDLHWAFDKGLFGLTKDGNIVISNLACNSNQNERLLQIQGVIANFPELANARPHPDALNWHLENRLLD